MGIELYSQILSLNNAGRCRLSKSQLVPSGANTFKGNATTELYLAGSEFRTPRACSGGQSLQLLALCY
jgi:hypothetical protein